MKKTTLGPSPPDPGARMCIPCLISGASLLGVLLPERPPLERLAAFLLLAAAVLAVTYSRKDEPHRPVRAGFLALTGADSVNAALHDTVLKGGPYFGGARVSFHLHEALIVASILVLPLVAVSVLAPYHRGARLLRTASVLVGLGVLVHLVASYSAVRELSVAARGEYLRPCYLLVELVSLFAASAVVVVARRRGRAPSLAATVIACLLVGRLALLAVGAWGQGLFGAPYSIHQAGLAGMYLAIVGLYSRSLRGDGRLAA